MEDTIKCPSSESPRAKRQKLSARESPARVAALYRQLSYPSATRFKAALLKRGIRVPDAFVRQLVQEQVSRLLFAPPPRFTGRVVAQHVDERWAGSARGRALGQRHRGPAKQDGRQR